MYTLFTTLRIGSSGMMNATVATRTVRTLYSHGASCRFARQVGSHPAALTQASMNKLFLSHMQCLPACP